MFEMIRKSLLASLGAAVVTKEKVEDATKRWVDEGKISRDEAEKLAADLLESGQHQWDEIQGKITETVRKGLDNLDIGSKIEFQELEERVAHLEKRVSELAGAKGTEEE
jgi:polyhydroxyalkanoate synthesis regulator phasin